MWKHSPDVVFRDLDGEAVILDLVSGTYFGLNEVGTRVWRLVDEGATRRKSSRSWPPSTRPNRETIARDVARLLDDLRTRLIVRTAAETDAP